MWVRVVLSSNESSVYRCGLGKLACVGSCGNKRGTRESKELVGVATPSDLVGSILVEILHSVEGGDVEQVCSNLETNLPCLRLLSLSFTCLYILHAYIVFIFICLIYCVLNFYMLGDYLLTLVFNQESQSGTSTLI